MPDARPTDEIIVPIGAQPKTAKTERAAAPLPPRRSLSTDIDKLTAYAAMITALATWALSAYFIFGFSRTDSGLWTLLSSFSLCIFVGALAYVPCFVLWRTALASSQRRASRKQLALALLLMLPWVCLSLVFIGASAMPKRYGILALALSLWFSYWAFIRLRAAPKLTSH